MTVSQRFDAFLNNIKLTDDQIADGQTKNGGVRKCLNTHYWNTASETAHSQLVGSWGKHTRIRPPRDIDVMFVLPDSVYNRFQQRTGNRQSQLLQEVKEVLQKTYSATRMRGDGQVVIVPFATYAVEVAPAFELTTGQYWICDTNDGGRYKNFDPNAEQKNISDSDTASSGNTRDLVRMMKKWQDWCSVPMKSFWIELLAVNFLSAWENKGKSSVYYDWMVRDFLKFIVTKADTFVFVPGTYELLALGNAWKSRAETARDRAIKACELESASKATEAGLEWQKIFGPDIPQ